MTNTAEIDVIIAGGGVAGAATAAALHQLGHRILLIEPGLHDDRRLAGEVFHPPGVMGLAELSLLDSLQQAPSARINGFIVTSGGSQREPLRLAYDDVLAHRMPGLGSEHRLIRQRLLDAVGRLSGVTVMRGKRVIAIDQSERSGVTVQVANGKATEGYRGRMVVAADGAHSRLGRSVGIGTCTRRISTMFGYRFSVAQLPDPDFGHVILGPSAPILVYPINGDEARILFDMPHRAGRLPRAEDCAEALPFLAPVLRAEVERAVAGQPRMSIITQASNSERLVQDRVALVGDAGGSCHPLTASGMTRCISDALLLRDALDESRTDWARALQLYDRRRRWPQATRIVLAEALRDAFCGSTPPSRIVRRGILDYCEASRAARSVTLALLSTADGRPQVLVREFIRVMVRGFAAHIRAPLPPETTGLRSACTIALGLVAAALGHVRQILDRISWPVRLRRAPPDNLDPDCSRLLDDAERPGTGSVATGLMTHSGADEPTPCAETSSPTLGLRVSRDRHRSNQ
ncbi:FAD-dependent oxidoreductase [Bradyrhizobium diazoefficiens]|uniref:FAD-dependent oxidoreductase n=1 Tax=Bradyrhizobium diazoefficiens TaxID=1355477 RepID=UPI00359BDEF8